jgi:hypothetical protein
LRGGIFTYASGAAMAVAGGITAYQLDAARAQAATEGRDYRPWIPDPTRV